MNPRLQQFLQVFYRLAQIEMLSETQIYVAIKIKSLLADKTHETLSLEILKESLTDLRDDEVMTVLNELAQKKYLSIRQGQISFSQYFLNQVLYG